MSKTKRTHGFSKREIQVLVLAGLDFIQKETAGLMFISHGTVKSHVKNMCERNGVKSITALLYIAIERGYLRPGFAPYRLPADINDFFNLN